ncbi:MAG: flagellar type III secretion system pore protein FliP [Candidatus Eremiobacteraeota bacterium]|nr:flagellar type III secretion system pore protein FliP [Candidatus Eremiobacteraeota bacterium]MBV8354353.1 flagellar type III secretion system pore protein FliP [Candidatus Eremiobacteraeota bacterium]
MAQAVPGPASPSPVPLPRLNIGITPASKPQDVAFSLQILLVLTILTLAPTLLVLLTSFTRIVVVLSFVRTAMGTQQVPPTQVLVGLALLLTFFVMRPVIVDINKNALQPYLGNKISQTVALNRAAAPLRTFMFKQTREKDIALFYSLSKEPRPAKQSDVPTYLLVPAFVISELKTAFEIGFAIYIPFIVIDMVVASILLSMGMMMIPPIIISLPFKILVFLLVDGWNLTVQALFASFHT